MLINLQHRQYNKDHLKRVGRNRNMEIENKLRMKNHMEEMKSSNKRCMDNKIITILGIIIRKKRGRRIGILLCRDMRVDHIRM